MAMSEDEALNKLILKIYLTDLCPVGVRESCFFKKGFQEFLIQKQINIIKKKSRLLDQHLRNKSHNRL